jgi:hypothetical protein
MEPTTSRVMPLLSWAWTSAADLSIDPATRPGMRRRALRVLPPGALTVNARSVSGLAEGIFDPGPQGGQRDGADLPGGHLSAAQHQQGRDGLGVEPL